ncbi:MAG: ABC transporter permease [Clostridiales bacterium]|jgi:peptide/nickel transport system permease protein|nr:ABC transporter permease [Clostridiales bacterium]
MKRLKLILLRIVQIIPVLLIVTMLAFWLSNVSAGDVANVTLQSKGIQPTEESLAAIREELGLNDPLPVQYINWLKKACRLDFGVSFQTNRPVTEEIFSRFPATLELAISASLLAVIFAIPLALLATRYRDSAPDHVIRVMSSIGATMPDFWIGLMLLYFFGVQLKIAPIVAGSKIQNIFLPAFTLSIQYAATYTRVLRGNLVEINRLDYIKAARARGLSEGGALVKHGLKNAILPVITLIGVNFGKLVGGQVAIETIFSWNGIGQFAISCMKVKDLPVIQGYIIIVLLAYVIVNLILDVVYMYIDPRIEVE